MAQKEPTIEEQVKAANDSLEAIKGGLIEVSNYVLTLPIRSSFEMTAKIGIPYLNAINEIEKAQERLQIELERIKSSK